MRKTEKKKKTKQTGESWGNVLTPVLTNDLILSRTFLSILPFTFENSVTEMTLIIHGQWHIQETLSLQAIKIH